MRVKFWFAGSAILAAVCLAGISASAQQQGSSQQQTGDPVADAARKAREAKKDTPKPKKVYTDDDVKTTAPGAAASATPGSPTAATAATTEQGPGDAGKNEDPNGESAWRKRFKEAHDKVAKAEKELDVLQREFEKAQTQYYTDPQKALTQQNNRADINDKTAKIDGKKKEIDQLKQALDDLEDQLRKSGGDPGWAR
jgi:predicted RNase H-like nuclease (RuvC/YqgF family)